MRVLGLQNLKKMKIKVSFLCIDKKDFQSFYIFFHQNSAEFLLFIITFTFCFVFNKIQLVKNETTIYKTAVMRLIKSSTDKTRFIKTDYSISLRHTFSGNDTVNGLGEQIRAINKHGWQYKSRKNNNPKGHHYVYISLNEILFFIREVRQFVCHIRL